MALDAALARFNLAVCIKAGHEIQGDAAGDPVSALRLLTAAQRDAGAAVRARCPGSS